MYCSAPYLHYASSLPSGLKSVKINITVFNGNFVILFTLHFFTQTCPGLALFDPVKLFCVPEKEVSCKPNSF